MDLLLRRRMLMDRLSAASDPYLSQPFTITVTAGSGSIEFIPYDYETQLPSTLFINKNNGGWQQLTFDGSSWCYGNTYGFDLSAGDTLQIKGTGGWGSSSSTYTYIYVDDSSLRWTLSGNINSLIHGDNFEAATTVPNYALYKLFGNSADGGNIITCITDITNLRFPATTLGTYCYSNLFYGNTNLVSAGITLPAATLSASCYRSMFYGNTKLTTPPVLPATTLASYCYGSMFYNCTSLTTAPDLPALTLESNCYRQMFQGCSHLNYIKAMFTTTPGTSYTRTWVQSVAATGTFVKNSAANWNVSGTSGIPSGWTVQTASS